MKIKKGFSLIEMTIVVALVAIIVTLTVVNVSSFNSMIVRSDVDTLHTVCMYLQRAAQVSEQPTELVFDAPGNYYTFGEQQEKLSSNTRFALKPGIKGPPSQPTATPKSAITFKNQCIRFSPRGIMQSGTVYMTDNNQSCAYALSSPIADYSYLRKYRYCQGRWILI